MVILQTNKRHVGIEREKKRVVLRRHPVHTHYKQSALVDVVRATHDGDSL